MAFHVRDGSPKPDEEKKTKSRGKEFAEMAKESSQKTPPGEPKEVDLEDEDESDEEDDDEVAAGPRQSRPSKRNRYAAIKQQAEEARKEADRERHRADMAELERRNLEFHANSLKAVIGPQKDKADIELDRLQDEENMLRDSFNARRAAAPNGELPAEEVNKTIAAMNRIRDKRTQVTIQRTMASQPQAATHQDVAAATAQAQLMARYPDLLGDATEEGAKKRAYFANLYNAERATSDSEAALESAAAGTRAKFGIRSAAPSAAKRSQYGGPGTTVANGGGSRPGKITLSPSQQAIAEARYKKLPPEQAHREWAKKHASDLQKLG